MHGFHILKDTIIELNKETPLKEHPEMGAFLYPDMCAHVQI